MGPGAQDENIISANFPDDNEELFYANEIIDLNDGSDPDMGLNLHFIQA